MNVPPTIQQLLERLPHSTQDILNAARHMEHRGDHGGAHDLLQRAYHHQADLRFLASLAFSMMKREEHAQAFEMLKRHLDERAPDPNLVILMAEALIAQGNFAHADQYIDYAARLGGAQPRIENLRALLAQRVREHQRGAHVPRDMALDSRIDLTQPDLMSLPLADNAFTVNEHSNDTTSFLGFEEDAPVTVALESVSTHVSHVSVQDLPTMAANVRYEESSRYQPGQTHIGDDSYSLPTVSRPAPDHSADLTIPVALDQTAHARDMADATIPFQRALHAIPSSLRDGMVDAPDDPTLHDGDDSLDMMDPLDDQVTSYASLQPNSPGGYQDHDLYLPLEEEESKSSVRAAFFGSSQDISDFESHSMRAPAPARSAHPDMADSAPSFGARPAALSPVLPLPAVRERVEPETERPRPRFEVHAGDRLPQNVSSSLELELLAPSITQHTHQMASAGDPQDVQRSYARPSRHLIPLAKLGLGVSVVAALLVMGGSLVADHMFTSTLIDARDRALEGAHDGTYQGSLEAFEGLSATASLSHPLGPWAETLSTQIAHVLPVYTVSSARTSIAGYLAYQAAWLEWRHEAPGTRQATALIDEASAQLGDGHDLVERARLYDAMHIRPRQAFEHAELAYRKAPNDIDFALPMALAAYDMGYTSLSRETLSHLTTLRATSQDQQHVQLILEDMHHDPAFTPNLEEELKDNQEASLELHLIRAQQQHTNLEELRRSATALNEALSTPSTSWHPCFTARIHHALSRVSLAERDFARVLRSLEQAHELCPELPFISKALITHFTLTGQHARAESMLADSTARHPSALFNLEDATLALNQGDTARHKKTLAPLVAFQHPIALTADAQRMLLLGDYTAALAQFTRAHERDPQGGLPMAYTHLIQAIMLPARSQEQDDALTALIKAQPFVSPELQRALALVKLERAQHISDPTQRASLFASAQRAITDFIATSQYEGIARFELCELYLAQRRYDSARESCEDATRIDSQSIQGKLARARLELESGSPARAKELLLPLDGARPDFLPLAELLIRTYISQGDFGVAEQRLNKLVTTYPNALVAQTLRGRLTFALGRYNEAIAALQRVADHSSHPVEAQVFLAYARIRTGSLQAVEEPLKSNLSHPLWGGYAWLALGELRRRQGRFEDAEQNLEEARALLSHPYISSWFKIETLTQRALNWQAKYGWNHPQVIRSLSQAEAIEDDTHADLNYLLGALELSKKKPNERAAIARLDRSLIIDPRHCASLRTLKDLDQTRSGSLIIATQLDLYCQE